MKLTEKALTQGHTCSGRLGRNVNSGVGATGPATPPGPASDWQFPERWHLMQEAKEPSFAQHRGRPYRAGPPGGRSPVHLKMRTLRPREGNDGAAANGAMPGLELRLLRACGTASFRPRRAPPPLAPTARARPPPGPAPSRRPAVTFGLRCARHRPSPVPGSAPAGAPRCRRAPPPPRPPPPPPPS